jgi:hypothetical protein
MCTDALRRIHCRLRDEGIEARILFTVHDSIVLLVVDDPAVIAQVSKIILYEMEDNLPYLPKYAFPNGVDWDLLPFKAEIEVKYTWGGKDLTADAAIAETVGN